MEFTDIIGVQELFENDDNIDKLLHYVITRVEFSQDIKEHIYIIISDALNILPIFLKIAKTDKMKL